MATEKTFSVVGVSTLNGKTKIRFANDCMRIKILQKNGHEDIDFITLDREMTKPEAINYLREIGWNSKCPEVQDAMDLVLYRNPQGPKAEPVAKYDSKEVEPA